MKEHRFLNRRDLMRMVPAAVAPLFGSTASGQQSPEIRALVFAANRVAGLPARGSLATMYCRGLLGLEGVVEAEGYPLPRELGGVRVRVAGAWAPILAVAGLDGYQVVNFQVPLEADIPETRLPEWPAVQSEPRARVDLEQEGRSVSGTFPVSKSPGEFLLWQDVNRRTPMVFRASDRSLIASDNPARVGDDLIALMTGMRTETDPVVPTGEAAPPDPLAVIHYRAGYEDEYTMAQLGTSSRSVRVGQVSLVPGLAGVFQVPFRLETVPIQIQLVRNFRYVPPFFSRVQRFTGGTAPLPAVAE